MDSIPLFKVRMEREAIRRASDVLTSGYIGQGQVVEDFEQRLREHFEWPYVLTVNSATSGLHLALHMAKQGSMCDEVLTSPLTCTATNWAILANGLKPVWVDIDPETGNMDLADAARRITNRTLAIMAVHWGGSPVDLERLYRHFPGQHVIEDCAHAWGAKADNRYLGTYGKSTAVYSFQAIKHLTTGDGGAMLLPDEDSYKRAKLLRWYGLDRESAEDYRCSQNVKEWGFKFHMNDIAAAIGLGNMPASVVYYRFNSAVLRDGLRNAKGVTLIDGDRFGRSSYWVCTIRVERREAFMKHMKAAGIDVSMVHSRTDHHDCVSAFRARLPQLDRYCHEYVCIPCGWWVSPRALEHIIDTIRKGW